MGFLFRRKPGNSYAPQAAAEPKRPVIHVPFSDTAGEKLRSDDNTLSSEDRQRLTRLEEIGWTAHNIRLSERVWTLPGHVDFLSHPRVQQSVAAVTHMLGRKDLTGVRVADLACLEGGLSLAFAQAGAEVLGVEGRASHISRCNFLREQFPSANLRFVQDDVKNFTQANYGTFDVVLGYGILYHLDEPLAWLENLACCTRRLLLLDTHYAPATDRDMEQLSPITFHTGHNPLGELQQVTYRQKTYDVRRFREFADDTPQHEIEGMPWSAIGNTWSLWLTRKSLYTALEQFGFTTVGERLDIFDDSHEVVDQLGSCSRSYFFALKT